MLANGFASAEREAVLTSHEALGAVRRRAQEQERQDTEKEQRRVVRESHANAARRLLRKKMNELCVALSGIFVAELLGVT